MNTLEHDQLIEMLGHAPGAAVEALRSTGLVELPPFSAIRVEPGDLRELVPPARNVDVVLLLDDEQHTVFALLVEVQAGLDPGLFSLNLAAEFGFGLSRPELA